MKLEQSFEVNAEIDKVWSELIDIERVAPCLPGAEVTEAQGDGTYKGNFQVKLGPTTAAYRGTLKLASVDEQARSVTMNANGQDRRGQGSAKATIVSTLSEHDGTTRVDISTDFTITGRLASFGRGGMINDVSNRLLRDFAQCLQSRIEGNGPPSDSAQNEQAAATQKPSGTSGGAGNSSAGATAQQQQPIQGLSLVSSVASERIKRTLTNAEPTQLATWAGGLVGVIVVWRLLRRLFRR
jgi:carbon monoxide dehydrogenase subunit G